MISRIQNQRDVGILNSHGVHELPVPVLAVVPGMIQAILAVREMWTSKGIECQTVDRGCLKEARTVYAFDAPDWSDRRGGGSAWVWGSDRPRRYTSSCCTRHGLIDTCGHGRRRCRGRHAEKDTGRGFGEGGAGSQACDR